MAIKVDVVSGFLGSGKTTLIRRLLQVCRQERVVLIENEFGEIGIDGELVERDGFEVLEISNGCICCIMQKDFVQMLGRVIKEFQPERIIIEPTGISILSEIIDVLRRPEFVSRVRINSLITIVDSTNYLWQCDVFGDFFEDQIGNASVLILSKSQLTDRETIDQISASIRKLYQKERDAICDPWDTLTDEELANLIDAEHAPALGDVLHAEYKPCSENEFDTLGLKSSRVYTREELEQILCQLGQDRYGQVLRGKGFLRSDHGFLDFSYTSGRFEIGENKYQSKGRLCLIGKNLREQELKLLFKVEVDEASGWLKF
jgi:G3E family GTPase